MINFDSNDILKQAINKKIELYDKDSFDEIDKEGQEEFYYN